MATNNNILRYMNLDYSDNKIMKDRARGGSDGDHRIAGGSDGDHRIAGATQKQRILDDVVFRDDPHFYQGNGFLDDIMFLPMTVGKRMLGLGALQEEEGGGTFISEDTMHKIAEKAGWGVGTLLGKLIFGGSTDSEYDKNMLKLVLLLAGRIEKLEEQLDAKYSDEDHKLFLNTVSKLKPKNVQGSSLADPVLLGSDPVSHTPKQYQQLVNPSDLI